MSEECRNIYKRARRRAGYTQEAAAEIINISVESLRAYETDRRVPSGDVVLQMMICYNCHQLPTWHLQATSTMRTATRKKRRSTNASRKMAGSSRKRPRAMPSGSCGPLTPLGCQTTPKSTGTIMIMTVSPCPPSASGPPASLTTRPAGMAHDWFQVDVTTATW